MKKIILITIISILSLSCSEKNNSEKIERLQIENDSLKSILSELGEKYIFDSIAIRDIPNYKNTYKLTSKVSGEIVFVGYNIGENTSVIMVDSFSYNPKRLYNPDTLELKNGGFIYETELTSDRTYLKGVLEMKSNYGKEYEGVYNTVIGTKKN
jgi:hypothetical protein